MRPQVVELESRRPLHESCRGIGLTWCIIAVLLPSGVLSATEPSAPIPVAEGLSLHFDAGALFKSGDAAGSDEPDPVLVESWTDASGKRVAVQSSEKLQPQLVRFDKSGVVRFDGVDDHLRVVEVGERWDSATLFVVGAARENPGGFRAFLAANQTGRRDFESGFTVDLGPFTTTALSTLNVEGRGFGGAQSLMQSPAPLGSLQVFEIVIDPETRKVALTVDSKPAGSRNLDPATLRIDELTLGARYYNLFSPEQQVNGHGAVDLAEVALYRRVLNNDERRRVREHLLAKHADLKASLEATLEVEGRTLLETVENPPAIQMFVPGFEVRELPLELPNINNVRYRADGKLVAAGYNGNVYLLSDTDGDGLEDRADLFWENAGRVRSPIGMALTPPGYKQGQGLFVATKSECLLLADTDGDDRADREIAIADGWKESFHNVDALGVAVDPRDHSVYFGLGTANFVDPLLMDKEGKPQYRLEEERGTILKVAPDFSRREVVCTGIRFPVALAFNREGDLFATDQEGATWVPNGNPLDELLHIQPGRHYGFPARHPKHLPGVIDEPSVYDYAPQHQSTCGLTFNEPVGDGPAFGPANWKGDALVCGYSRGKLYRTKLHKTAAGYVADNRLVAALNMLTVDSCVSPAGDLVVAVHSGGPDWGSGPSGQGKLYRVRYVDQKAPQPVATWSAGPSEVRVAFDRALDPEHLQGLADQTRITYGEFVRAGDEFETLRPGYEVVAGQINAMRRELPVHSALISADRRTLTLITDPQRAPVHYAVQLPGLGRPEPAAGTDAPHAPLPQHARIDLDYSLQGLQAQWTGTENWEGWLPHFNLDVSRDFTRGSAEHERLFELLESPGRLTLSTQLDLDHMLRPEVQPGSRIDFELPPEQVTLRFESSSPFQLRIEGSDVASRPEGEQFIAVHTVEPQGDQRLPVELTLEAPGGTKLDLQLTWSTAEDERPRAMPLRRFFLPWAEREDSTGDVELTQVRPELEGGSWARGRKLFLSDAAQCSKCHKVQGQGERIGPDLSNLVHRDYASVLRDVSQPSYAINPDYITHNFVLRDGRVLSGTVRSDGSDLLISDTQGKVTRIAGSAVEESAASSTSIMPDDLTKKLTPDQMRDLLTFLLTPPPQMPRDHPQPAPEPRLLKDVQAVLAGAPEPPEATRPLHVVLVAGPKDHGPGEHDYPAWQQAWAELLRAAEGVEVATAWEWPEPADFEEADVLVFYQRGTWTPERATAIDAFLDRGGGLVYVHYAVDGGQDAPGFAQRIGLAWRGGYSKFRHGPLDLGFETGEGHPIARNFSQVKFVDESYWNLVGDRDRITAIASGVEDGAPQPLFWTLESGRGRVFVSIPGHFSWTFDDPLYRILLLRGIAWSANSPVDRFNDIVLPGARLQ